ncbi:MAG: succinyl-diaminopimelate desuccinylase [Methylacidiphilales bacterium]|nr:succinyl-diaminopimelate desuccinylase [Candidatus Methylacidiphilales bacterium]
MMNVSTEIISHLTQLIKLSSITPDDAGCQQYIADQLTKSGYTYIDVSKNAVTNTLFFKDKNKPLLLFVGHTDVVPPGPLELWNCDPFTLTINDDTLYGRGVADMKGSVSVMIKILQQFNDSDKNIALLLTSDEEGDAIDGVRFAISSLLTQGFTIELAIVGEPTASLSSGDTIKIGRRGSINSTIIVKGKPGHVAYPDLTINPIILSVKPLQALCEIVFDLPCESFDLTQLQCTSVYAGNKGLRNVIPATATIEFNIRFSPAYTEVQIKEIISRHLQPFQDILTTSWTRASLPYLTTNKKAISLISSAVKSVTKKDPILSTSGGTSDGRFLSHELIPVIELGPPNATIHKPNEQILLRDLESLYTCYYQIVQAYFPDCTKVP